MTTMRYRPLSQYAGPAMLSISSHTTTVDLCAACGQLAGQPSSNAPHDALRFEYAEPAIAGDPESGDYSCFQCRRCGRRLVRCRALDTWQLLPPGLTPI